MGNRNLGYHPLPILNLCLLAGWHKARAKNLQIFRTENRKTYGMQELFPASLFLSSYDNIFLPLALSLSFSPHISVGMVYAAKIFLSSHDDVFPPSVLYGLWKFTVYGKIHGLWKFTVYGNLRFMEKFTVYGNLRFMEIYGLWKKNKWKKYDFFP